jgi:c-di-GMP-binding flagellar brake protein YcgR
MAVPSSGILVSVQRDDRRRYGRVGTEDATCVLGKVLDLSGSGMRVQCKGRSALRVGEAAQIQLKHPTAKLTLIAEAVWLDQSKRRRPVLGLSFVDVTDEQREQLAEFRRSSAKVRMLDCSAAA